MVFKTTEHPQCMLYHNNETSTQNKSPNTSNIELFAQKKLTASKKGKPKYTLHAEIQTAHVHTHTHTHRERDPNTDTYFGFHVSTLQADMEALLKHCSYL